MEPTEQQGRIEASQVPVCRWLNGESGSPGKPIPISLTDVMSEQKAKELHDLELEHFNSELLESGEKSTLAVTDDYDHDSFFDDDDDDDVTSSDFLLAQSLQLEYDLEHDSRLKKEEAKYNGQSKVSLSFSKYLSTHPYLEGGHSKSGSDSESDEDLWIDGEKDTIVKLDKFGYGNSGKGKTSTAATIGMMRNADKIPDEQAVGPKTRLMLSKLINTNILESLSGVISNGKESVIFHAQGGSNQDLPVAIPAECVVKVYKTTLNAFHNRSQYVLGDYRFSKDDSKKLNPRKLMRMWTEKELLNLRKLRRVGIRCPEPIMQRKHLLLMSFIGEERIPAAKLKDMRLDEKEWEAAYEQTLNAMTVMYRDARLVHADLSEYNLLYHNGNVWVIDVSQSVDLAHPKALEFLLRDCKNVSGFFAERVVLHVPTRYQLFNDITGLNFTGEGADFLSEIHGYQDRECRRPNDSRRKDYQFDHLFNRKTVNDPQDTCKSKSPVENV